MYTSTGCRISEMKNSNSGSFEAGFDRYPKFSLQINVCSRKSSGSMKSVIFSSSFPVRAGNATFLSMIWMCWNMRFCRLEYSPIWSPSFRAASKVASVISSTSDSLSEPEAESCPASVSRTFLICCWSSKLLFSTLIYSTRSAADP